MTDESALLRRLIADELTYHLASRSSSNVPVPDREIAHRVAEEVLRQLERMGVQVVRLNALGPRGDDA